MAYPFDIAKKEAKRERDLELDEKRERMKLIETNKPKFKCDICGATKNTYNKPFTSEKAIKIHRTRAHEAIKPKEQKTESKETKETILNWLDVLPKRLIDCMDSEKLKNAILSEKSD